MGIAIPPRQMNVHNIDSKYVTYEQDGFVLLSIGQKFAFLQDFYSRRGAGTRRKTKSVSSQMRRDEITLHEIQFL